MSTGRNSCPPAWVDQLISSIQGLGGSAADPVQTCSNLGLTPMCDSSGIVMAYASVVYACLDGAATTLYFDTALNPLASTPSGLTVCVPAGRLVGVDPLLDILTGSNLAAYTAAVDGTLIDSELGGSELAAARAGLQVYGAPDSAMVYTTLLGGNNQTVANTAVDVVSSIPADTRLYIVGFVSNTISPVTAKLYDVGLTNGFNLGSVRPPAGGVHYYAIKGGVPVDVASQVAFGGQPNQFYGVNKAGQQAKFRVGNVTGALINNRPAGFLYGFQGMTA